VTFVQKWWSVLFGAVMAAAVGLFVVAGFFPGLKWWLPKNVSSFGDRVDGLFYLILWITGFFFILTEALLVYFLYAYTGTPGQKAPAIAADAPLQPSLVTTLIRPLANLIHDQHRLELAWSIVPAGILLYIGIAQIGAWEEIKYQSKMPIPGQQTQQIEVSARQFEWRVRYPSPERMAQWESMPKLAEDFAKNPHEDDVWVVNQVHVWKDNKVLVHLNTKDVIHSFYFPNLRLKQDALPGKTIPVWFMVNEANTVKNNDRWVDGYLFKDGTTTPAPEQVWELACAELCGWGHYKMLGRLYVHPTKQDFLDWLQQARSEQNRTEPAETKITAAR
jgi:cytochrome c oxidase subunit 2